MSHLVLKKDANPKYQDQDSFKYNARLITFLPAQHLSSWLLSSVLPSSPHRAHVKYIECVRIPVGDSTGYFWNMDVNADSLGAAYDLLFEEMTPFLMEMHEHEEERVELFGSTVRGERPSVEEHVLLAAAECFLRQKEAANQQCRALFNRVTQASSDFRATSSFLSQVAEHLKCSGGMFIFQIGKYNDRSVSYADRSMPEECLLLFNDFLTGSLSQDGDVTSVIVNVGRFNTIMQLRNKTTCHFTSPVESVEDDPLPFFILQKCARLGFHDIVTSLKYKLDVASALGISRERYERTSQAVKIERHKHFTTNKGGRQVQEGTISIYTDYAGVNNPVPRKHNLLEQFHRLALE